MQDDQHGQMMLLAQAAQQVEHAALDEYLEGGKRFIGCREQGTSASARASTTRWRWPALSCAGSASWSRDGISTMSSS
ncbi:MAG: hypothetical protein ONB48_18830 [candidate division KSB1 bacterium]|nr:hypothetical protein [candidate division KSB1 bacterium]MDZ7287702.1 hypothetical protein [candidate division KSB1 bacterium]MDZ7299958.1 hypothetical protein [candidate division KSB1 bacterium]MDZ7305713.1 hypothetical protein [candidate division KSB1 bacterium]MDZ7350957.1 hypothetical protein [candidate division KSB1 bacterium]